MMSGTLSPEEQQLISWDQSYNSVGLIPTDGIEDPLPACGEFINSQTWGPVTNATVWDPVCDGQGGSQDGTSYRAHNHYKKKRLYQHGYTWRCYDLEPTICHTSFRESCPQDTCASTDL